MTKPYFHLEPLAVIFSLTYALLMWSCVASVVPLSPDSDDDKFVQRLCILYRSVAVLLPEYDDGDSGLRGSRLRDRRHPHTLVHREFLGLEY